MPIVRVSLFVRRCRVIMVATSSETGRKRAVPIIREDELNIISHSPAQTQRLGARLGALLKPGHIICLSGDMGAGKTVFASGIGVGWGARQPLTSPTFALVHTHSRLSDELKLYHMDCYRLSSALEVDALGLDDIIEGEGPVIFEWPERIYETLPEERLWIEFGVLEQTRRNLVFEGLGASHTDLVMRFREEAFGI